MDARTAFACIWIRFGLDATASLQAAPKNYTFSSVDFPGAARTVARGANSIGTIVGYYSFAPLTSPAGDHGFTFLNGAYQTVDFPGAPDAWGTQLSYVFATSTNTDLVVNYWDGSAWHWADQGLPPGATGADGTCEPITYKDAAGNQRIYTFTESNSNHLVVNYWNGFGWFWADQGFPPGASLLNSPDAITYKDMTGTNWIYLFAIADGKRLVVNYWDGSAWHWADQGAL